MMMAIRARTEARTPKMMVPVESVFDWVLVEVVVWLMDGQGLRVLLVLLDADMFAMRVLVRVQWFWNVSAASLMDNGMVWQM